MFTTMCLRLQGVPKNLPESGAHKTPIQDTFTLCAGCCSHIGFSFLKELCHLPDLLVSFNYN